MKISSSVRKMKKRDLKENLLTDCSMEGGEGRTYGEGTAYLKSAPRDALAFAPSINSTSSIVGGNDLQQSMMPDVPKNRLGKGISQLKKYETIFEELTEKQPIITGEGMVVVEIAITYDAKSAICITRDEASTQPGSTLNDRY